MSAYSENDYLFKILILGDSQVGKTSVANRFCESTFESKTEPTNGVDFKLRNMNYNGQLVKFQIWDSSGHEKFRKIVQQYCRGMSGFLLCFDLTKKETFEGISKWLSEIEDYKTVPEAYLLLVGNKSDLKEKRQVSTEEISSLTKEYKLDYIEVSAKDDVQVTELFNKMFEMVASRGMNEGEEDKKATMSTDGYYEIGETSSSFCCCCFRFCCCCCSCFFNFRN